MMEFKFNIVNNIKLFLNIYFYNSYLNLFVNDGSWIYILSIQNIFNK